MDKSKLATRQEHRNAKLRLKRLEKALRQGRLPVIRKYTPGVYALLERYGIDLDNYFVPSPSSEHKQQDEKLRRALKNRKHYERGKQGRVQTLNSKGKRK